MASPSFAIRTSRCASAAGPKASAGELVGRLPGHVRLEVPVAAAGAEDAVVDDDHVAELRAGADRASVGAPAEDQSAADARAEREHDHVGRAAAGSGAPLRDRRRVAVVVDRHGQRQPLAHHVSERHVDERDVHRPDRRPGSLVDPRRDAEADRDDALVEQLADRGLEPVEELVLRFERGRVLAVRGDRPVAADDAGEDLRPADVDTDHVGHHGRGYPIAASGPEASQTDTSASRRWGYHSPPDAAGREALPPLPRRKGQGQGPGGQARAPGPTPAARQPPADPPLAAVDPGR